MIFLKAKNLFKRNSSKNDFWNEISDILFKQKFLKFFRLFDRIKSRDSRTKFRVDVIGDRWSSILSIKRENNIAGIVLFCKVALPRKSEFITPFCLANSWWLLPLSRSTARPMDKNNSFDNNCSRNLKFDENCLPPRVLLLI